MESLIWSAYTGGFGMLILISFGVASYHRTVITAQQVLWLLVCFVSGLARNGLIKLLLPDISAAEHATLKVVLGPVCIALSSLAIRSWLSAPQRHRNLDVALLVNAGLGLLAGAACLLLPEPRQFPASAVVALLLMLSTTVLCGWAALLGDRFGMAITVVSLCMTGVLGLQYALALHLTDSLALQATAALCNLCGLLATSVLVWLRSHQEYNSLQGQQVSATHDPATGLYNGKTLITKILQTQRRLKLRSGEGAVMAVVVMDLPSLEGQIGPGGIHQLLVRAGARVRQEAGLGNPVGRYFDRCFLVVLETLRSTADLQTLANALAQALSQPIQVQGLHGETQSVVLRVGIGASRLTHHTDVAAILHRAEASARNSSLNTTAPDVNTSASFPDLSGGSPAAHR